MLIIPVYHKIRADFMELYALYRSVVTGSPIPEELPPETNRRLLLMSQNTYKSSIQGSNVVDKYEVLTAHLLKFLWIIRTQHENIPYYRVS